VPLGNNDFSDVTVTNPLTGERIETGIASVSGSFFRTLEIPMMAGRDFTGGEPDGSNLVIVNEAMAKQLWRGESAVGKVAQSSRPLEIIGVHRAPLPAHKTKEGGVCRRCSLRIRFLNTRDTRKNSVDGKT
jgi:hypothetical protein